MGDAAELYMEMQESGFCDWVERLYGKCDSFELIGAMNLYRMGINIVTNN